MCDFKKFLYISLSSLEILFTLILELVKSYKLVVGYLFICGLFIKFKPIPTIRY